MSPTDIAVPRRRDAFLFEAKAWAHRLRRVSIDLLQLPPRHRPARRLEDAPVLAEFRGRLWQEDSADPRLVAGKVQNLRRAAPAFHGIEPSPHAVLSFWRQLGRPSRRRGFAVGRELREGCLVPSPGGGLCQLSNALYDCAVRAGLTVVERHRHSRVLPGSLAEQDRDATVFWNYLDLRIAAPFPWRCEVQLDATHLIVRLRGHAPMPPAEERGPADTRVAADTGECGPCQRTTCYRYTALAASANLGRTWLIADEWPEHRRYREAEQQVGDRSIVVTAMAAWHVRLVRRLARWCHAPLPAAQLRGLRALAGALARRLRAEDVHLVIPQGVLPFLWADGHLAGRRFDVLMSALPMGQLQARLDAAAARYPDSRTLSDYRGAPSVVQAEAEALAAAARWITPHAQVSAAAGVRAVTLPWIFPSPIERSCRRNASETPTVLLGGASLARKGVHALREALRGMTVQLLLLPGATEEDGFWHGVDVRPVDSLASGIRDADVVVLPAWVEHQPRALLLALASGVPVIASDACGLPSDARWHSVPEGDSERLRQSLDAVLQSRAITCT